MSTLTDIYTPEWFAENRGPSVLSASVVVPVIVELIQPESVVDFGCGQGEWLGVFGNDIVRAGVDIAISAFPPPVANDFYRYDLVYPFHLRRRFDLALCLEVGEHLPEDAADTLVDTITRHSDTIVFSAAVPGQEGLHHVNCQPHSYWHEKFSHREYAMEDSIRPRIRYDARVSEWYRRNIFLYRR